MAYFSGFVIAGGKSSRMKTDKAFLKFGGKTFLENAIDALKPNCTQIKVVLNKHQKHFVEKLPDDISHIFDIYENRGALGGIHAALMDCKTEYAIILAVDLPLIKKFIIAELCRISLDSKEFIATVPRQTDGRFQPLCAVYHARYCLLTLEKLMNENDSASVRDFLEIISPQFVDQNRLTTNKPNNIFFNVNNPVDFQQLK